jgi:hypothetical protein
MRSGRSIIFVLAAMIAAVAAISPAESAGHRPGSGGAATSGNPTFAANDLAACSARGVVQAGPPGVSALGRAKLLTAFPIVNRSADSVRLSIRRVTLRRGRLAAGLVSAPRLPISFGTLAGDGSKVLQVNFSPASIVPGARYALTLTGRYLAAGNSTSCRFTTTTRFQMPRRAPGKKRLTRIAIGAHVVRGAQFPSQKPQFDEEVNPSFWTVPTGRHRRGTPTKTETGSGGGIQPIGLAAGGNGLSRAFFPAITFPVNVGLGLSTNVSTTAEPSGAVGGGVVFVTTNWTAAYSTNNGTSWTQIDPTTIFPNDAVGYCCDQIVQYVPSINRFVWLLQGNGDRLAVASPADIISSGGTAWTYWNLTPQVFGQPVGTGFDYPDLSVGTSDVYMSWDAGSGCPAGCTGGFQVVRTSKAGLQAGGTITLQYTNPADSTMAWGSHLSQDTGNEIYWAGHNNNSQMRVFSLAESSNSYFWRDVNISSWANNAPTSLTPDGKDWLAKNFHGPGGNSFPGNGVIGATRVGSDVWFAWTAGTNSSFPQAHVEMVELNRSSNFAKVQQVQVWNRDYAFAYPALATNACTKQVGMSFEYGGNKKFYENHVVGFWGDYVAYITTSSSIGTTRYGDYVTIRQVPATKANPGNLFAAFGYGLNKLQNGGTQVDHHYVLFGRPATQCK